MLKPGFRSRSREPDGSETLRHPVDILLLELMKALLKILFTNLLYFGLWEPGAAKPAQNRRLRNPS